MDHDVTSKSEEPLILQLAREMNKTTDADRFCYKALKHVAFLLEAEKCSLYWIRNSFKAEEETELVSRLLDVHAESTFESVFCDSSNEVVHPISYGCIGHVARTKSPLNISDVKKNTIELDKQSIKLDEELKSLLCYPLVLEQDMKLVGVVEVVNKQSAKSFTYDDEEVLEHFILLCSLAIANCQKSLRIEQHQQCTQLQESLMNKITGAWPTMTYDDVMRIMMTQLCQLIECLRYTLVIALFDPQQDDCDVINDVNTFTRSYDVIKRPSDHLAVEIEVTRLKKSDWVFHSHLIEQVVEAKKIMILPKIPMFSEYAFEDKNKNFTLENVFCMPIYGGGDNQRLLGLLHLANKIGGFLPKDQILLESLTPYLMSGILYSNSFNSIQLQTAKSDVTEEMLRYHMTSSDADVTRLQQGELPPNIDIYDFRFCDCDVSDDGTILVSMKMFQGLDVFNKFKIDEKTMLRWLLTVKKSYRDVTYHNWRHGFNVAHTMSLLIHYMKKDQLPYMGKIFTLEEQFSLIVACLCHDADHRGTNNSFLIRSQSPLASLYSTSTLENHHYDNFTRSIQVHNIFGSFESQQFNTLAQFIRKAILATDLGLYFQRRDKFKSLLKTAPEKRDFTAVENKSLLLSIMMTSCDLSQTTKPWDAQYNTAKAVTSEFYDQGDLEREMFGTDPMPMMDRKYSDDLAKMQIGFIDGVCSMAYQMMMDFCSLYAPLHNGMQENRKEWVIRAEKKKAENLKLEVEEKNDEKYSSLWVKYWNADPDNFIWGIDPDVVVPDVVIERVVFSPKKRLITGGPSSGGVAGSAKNAVTSSSSSSSSSQRRHNHQHPHVTSPSNAKSSHAQSSTTSSGGGLGWTRHKKKKRTNKVDDVTVTGGAMTSSQNNNKNEQQQEHQREVKSSKTCVIM